MDYQFQNATLQSKSITVLRRYLLFCVLVPRSRNVSEVSWSKSRWMPNPASSPSYFWLAGASNTGTGTGSTVKRFLPLRFDLPTPPRVMPCRRCLRRFKAEYLRFYIAPRCMHVCTYIPTTYRWHPAQLGNSPTESVGTRFSNISGPTRG